MEKHGHSNDQIKAHLHVFDILERSMISNL